MSRVTKLVDVDSIFDIVDLMWFIEKCKCYSRFALSRSHLLILCKILSLSYMYMLRVCLCVIK
jgi:hypothetical protein